MNEKNTSIDEAKNTKDVLKSAYDVCVVGEGLPGEWEAFKQQIDQLDVWSWESDYEDPGAVDGTNWTVDLKYPDKGISSEGGNNLSLVRAEDYTFHPAT